MFGGKGEGRIGITLIWLGKQRTNSDVRKIYKESSVESFGRLTVGNLVLKES